MYHAVTHSRGHNCEMFHQKRMTEAYRHFSRLLSHNITEVLDHVRVRVCACVCVCVCACACNYVIGTFNQFPCTYVCVFLCLHVCGILECNCHLPIDTYKPHTNFIATYIHNPLTLIQRTNVSTDIVWLASPFQSHPNLCSYRQP